MEKKILYTGIRHQEVPQDYVRSESDRPNLSQVRVLQNIPIIDLGCNDRRRIILQIADSCQNYGFFQIINHGVPEDLMKKMMQTSHEFFDLPVKEKMKYYSNDPAKKIRLSTSFNVKKEQVHNWRDFLRLHCHPLHEYVHEWPSEPSTFRDVVSRYCKEIRKLGLRLEGFISESLGLKTNYIENVLGEQEQHMAINYYPPCPKPELTYGLPRHTDPNALTILLQDQEVAGLQVYTDGKWAAVNPYPNAFIVNIGDQLQALSNGKYRSVWHRAVVNSDKERMSIASFLSPAYSALLTPASELTNGGSTVIYRSFTYEEYYKKFWSRNLDQEHCLELFKKI